MTEDSVRTVRDRGDAAVEHVGRLLRLPAGVAGPADDLVGVGDLEHGVPRGTLGGGVAGDAADLGASGRRRNVKSASGMSSFLSSVKSKTAA